MKIQKANSKQHRDVKNFGKSKDTILLFSVPCAFLPVVFPTLNTFCKIAVVDSFVIQVVSENMLFTLNATLLQASFVMVKTLSRIKANEK